MNDAIAPAADENENLGNVDTAKKNEHHPTADPQAAFRQWTRALLQHRNRLLPGDANTHQKMDTLYICRRIRYYMEGNASEKALHRVMRAWKFVYKIKSQWKRCKSISVLGIWLC